MSKYVYAFFLLLGVTSISVQADELNAQKLANKYAAIAKNIDPNFKGPSAEAGRAFYVKEVTLHGATGKISCSACHTDNPANQGEDINTKKKIKSVAPAVEPKRFTDIDKVEKNFEKHCQDIIKRDCTAQEKADYITYLLSVKK